MSIQGGNAWRRKPQDEFENRREVPWSLATPAVSVEAQERPDPAGLLWVRRPETDLVAMMQAAPGAAEVESVESQDALADELADAVEQMDERLRWVFQAHVNRGLSFSQIAVEIGMSKSRAHELYQLAQAELIALLRDAPITQERLGNR